MGLMGQLTKGPLATGANNLLGDKGLIYNMDQVTLVDLMYPLVREDNIGLVE